MNQNYSKPNSPWLNKDSRTFLSRGYLASGQTAEDRIKVISDAAEKYLKIPGFSQKIEEIILKGWISLSSPVWSNFGLPRGLPISCNGSFIDDTVDSILDKQNEIGKMSQLGAGTSAYLGALRPRGSIISTGGLSEGPVHFVELFESTVNVISQSNVRRGSCAVYLPVTHPDIKEFLFLREEGSNIHHISLGVTVPDDWMEEMIEGDSEKRKIWARIIKKRFETGYPYIIFTDNANNQKPKWYKDYPIYASNLCSEIMLPSTPEESFVCCLASMNLLYYHDWKDTDAVYLATLFLDAVMEEYIQKTKDIYSLRAAHKFSVRHRALGLGVLGWHSFLQSQMIPFESNEARKYNMEIFKKIQEESYRASRWMAQEYGEPDAIKGSGMRNGTTMALAPTTSSSFILGQVSPSIEPENSNYYVKDLAKGSFTHKNRYLKKLLKEKGLNTDEVWESILLRGGSVQHLLELSEHEKNVFKTFGEIMPIELITQAAVRQKYIDQGQSLNLMIHPDAPVRDINALLIEGWKLGIKSFYYQRGVNPSQEYARSLLACEACSA